MRKGDVSEIIMTIFVLAVGILIFALLVPKIAIPSMSSYGNGQAYATAKLIASSINSLSSMEEGEITKTLELEWDVSIECEKENHCYVEVSHQDFISNKIGEVGLLGNVKEIHIYNLERVSISKAGETIRIEKIEIEE